MLIKILLFLFTARIVVDTFWSADKPREIVLGYTLLISLVSIIILSNSRSHRNLSLLAFTAMALFFSSYYSNINLVDHLNFSLQVFIPILFLVACKANRVLLQKAGAQFRKYLALPCLLVIVGHVGYNYNIDNPTGLDIIDYFTNHPNHVIAQTILKLSLVFLFDSGLLFSLSFAILVLFNVRSATISSAFAAVSFYAPLLRPHLRLRNLLVLGILGIAISIFVALAVIFFIKTGQLDLSSTANRFLYRGRVGLAFESDISNISSGRTELYGFYIDYIVNNFRFRDWLFGAGPIWVRSTQQHLSAHNDVLNLLVAFGLIGLGAVTYCYYYFFSSLPRGIRLPASGVFLFLFFTNGVVFHQSTMLFALLYSYERKPEHARSAAQ